jgi:hypothetical protein
MTVRKRYDPSATFRVTKYFVEAGRKWNVGEIYEPHFGSARRSFRHWVARRIERVEEGQDIQAEAPVKEAPVEEAPTEDSDSDVAEVVVDNEEDFQVVYKGVQFDINRNQIREDGSLTAGGLKAYKAAIK